MLDVLKCLRSMSLTLLFILQDFIGTMYVNMAYGNDWGETKQRLIPRARLVGALRGLPPASLLPD